MPKHDSTDPLCGFIPMSDLLLEFKGEYSRYTIYRWVSRGMPHKRLGRKLWFSKIDVLRWLEREFS